MSDKVKAIKEKASGFLKKAPKAVYIALAVLVVVAIGVAVFLNTRPYGVLFTDLSSTEMQSILGYLDSNGLTDYKVEGGDTILVPERQEARLKAKLLMEGYPQSGFAYTYSEGSGPFSTKSERAAAEMRDLQDRLSAVVRCFDGVKNAVVTITPSEDHRYVLDSENLMGAKASVLVEMRDGAQLNDKYAEAIRKLVSHSVKGLTIDSVEILDSNGNAYGAGDGLTDSEASALKLQLEAQWENKIRTNVLQVLTPYYGEKNVKVGVNCTVDVDRTVEDSTDVRLPQWADDGSTNGRGIVGSRIYDYVVVRDKDDATGGTVGTTTNADLPEYVEDLPELDGGEKEIQASGQVDYDNSRTETHVIRTAGYLTDCTISVSINATTAGEVDTEEVMQHVARVSGIRGTVDQETGKENFSDRISVMAMPFYEEPVTIPIGNRDGIPVWAVYVAAGVLLFIILIAVLVLLLLKKKKKAKLKKQQRELERQKAEAVANGDLRNAMAAYQAQQAKQAEEADVMNLRMEKSIELRQDLRKFAEENPEIAAQMIKNWLKGEDE